MNMNNTKKSRILVIDDEISITSSLKRTLELSEYQCDTANCGREALRKLRAGNTFDLIITDIRLPDISGIEILDIVRIKYPFLPVIVITGFASIESTKEAIRKGALDYLPKPFTSGALLSAVKQALRSSTTRSQYKDLFQIVSQSNSMDKIMDMVTRVGRTESTVLITGESGTGKELIARAIHRNSRRSTQQFVTVNSGAIPEGLLESELFGHVKGAFTGAITTSHGRFHVADGGSLFLDEVGNMSLAMQVKLLRVLQDGEFSPVGSSDIVKADVRLVAATNMNLEQAISNKTFREDLYYRLNVIEIHLPPLRQRTDDILPLSEFFLSRLADSEHSKKLTLSSSVVSALLSYNWPGNVRELENTMERASVLCDSGQVELHDLPDRITYSKEDFPDLTPTGDQVNLDSLLSSIEKHYITNALKKSGGNKTSTANMLGLKRTTLLARMKHYSIQKDKGNSQDE
ncbi:MAG: sigma-54-dependent Fis family transcriptional regulator [Candidatus Aegiribacteria sp.]|nr:sigma-54-dependent Fis family transcriptional regulator [Candidatus Aegiribacteria sp.]